MCWRLEDEEDNIEDKDDDEEQYEDDGTDSPGSVTEETDGDDGMDSLGHITEKIPHYSDDEDEEDDEDDNDEVYIRRARNVSTNQQGSAISDSRGRSNSEGRQLEEKLRQIDADDFNCKQKNEDDEGSKEDESSNIKLERLEDLSTDTTVLRRDQDDKTSVLESNSGGLLWSPPQSLSGPVVMCDRMSDELTPETNKQLNLTMKQLYHNFRGSDWFTKTEMGDVHHWHPISDMTEIPVKSTTLPGTYRVNRHV